MRWNQNMFGSLSLVLGLSITAQASPVFHATFDGNANDLSGNNNHLTGYGTV